jgi:hypothetical protein
MPFPLSFAVARDFLLCSQYKGVAFAGGHHVIKIVLCLDISAVKSKYYSLYFSQAIITKYIKAG